jgi:hypothetical protein
MQLRSSCGDLRQSARDALHLLSPAGAEDGQGAQMMDVPPEVLVAIAIIAACGCLACLYFAIKDKW